MYGKAALATRVGSSGTSPSDGGHHNIVGCLSKRTRVKRREEARCGAEVSALTKGTLKEFTTSIKFDEGCGNIHAINESATGVRGGTRPTG